MGFLYITLGLYGLIFKATFADFDMIILGHMLMGYSLVIRSRKKLLEKCLLFVNKKLPKKLMYVFKREKPKGKSTSCSRMERGYVLGWYGTSLHFKLNPIA